MWDVESEIFLIGGGVVCAGDYGVKRCFWSAGVGFFQCTHRG